MIEHIYRIRLGAVAVASVLLLAACGGSGDSSDNGDVTETTSSSSNDTVIIAIPGTPQGIDVDLQAGPQTWTIGGQVWELGAEWDRRSAPDSRIHLPSV
jgi:hypothetical protein